ncbi:MAG TPA: efflux RND transporter periplasmic adaptor subunit [Gemmataceae bacterium]|jgi:HlyD family secretion protein|nr:efflux RND transporter periplasmic adaptor subunit [Gemmataceae bacterium]
MRRLLTWLIIIGVIFGGIAAASIPAAAWLREHYAPRYITAQVSRGAVETVVNSTGTIKPVRSVSVGAFTSGPIAEIYVDYNSVVKKDSLLARIDPKLFAAGVDRDRAALDTQKAELKRVEALLQQAKNNEVRARKLMAVNKDYLSDTEMDQYYFGTLTAAAQVNLAKASIAQAEATLKNSEANLGYTEIRSPVDGIVIERKVDPGQTVAASFQTPELFIVAPDMEKHMHVFASVDEADIGLIRAAQERGKAVKFTVDAYPGDLFEGKIYQIRKSSSTTQNVVTYPVVIETPNPQLKLFPGMTANISFEIETKDNALRLPSAALRFIPTIAQVRPEDRQFVEDFSVDSSTSAPLKSATEKSDMSKKRQRRIVWVQDGDLLRAVPVTLGLMQNQYAELLTGDLADGQAVVTGLESVITPR